MPFHNHCYEIYRVMTHKFELNDKPFIPLNMLLKYLQLVETGGEANIRISDGEVRVNNAVETQKRKKLRTGDTVQFGKEIVEIM